MQLIGSSAARSKKEPKESNQKLSNGTQPMASSSRDLVPFQALLSPSAQAEAQCGKGRCNLIISPVHITCELLSMKTADGD